jgi:hypothetical protein
MAPFFMGNDINSCSSLPEFTLYWVEAGRGSIRKIRVRIYGPITTIKPKTNAEGNQLERMIVLVEL